MVLSNKVSIINKILYAFSFTYFVISCGQVTEIIDVAVPSAHGIVNKEYVEIFDL